MTSIDLNNLDLAADGLVIAPEEELADLPNDQRALAKIPEVAQEAIVRVRTERTQLQKSGDLTETGLNRKLEETGRNELEKVERFSVSHIADAKEKATVLEKRIAQIPDADAGDSARAIEIRNHLDEVSDVERMAILEEALASGETEVARAVFSAPVFLQRKLIAADDLRSDFRRRYEEQTQPAVVSELNNLKALIRRAENAIVVARQQIAAASGASADPDVSRLLQMA